MPYLLTLLLLNAGSCLIQSEFTLTRIDIDRTTTKEVVKGNLYLLDNPPIVLFEVSSPVNQLMWIKRDTTDIYYPDEKKLFRILSHDILPTQNTPVSGVFNMDLEHQLHLAGFKAYKARKAGDTIFFFWKPKEDSPILKKMSEIVTGHIGEDLVLYRAEGKGFKLEFQLSDFKTLNNKRYPSFLRSVVEQGKTKRIEELRLSGVKANTPLPNRLRDYKIPADAIVKTVQW